MYLLDTNMLSELVKKNPNPKFMIKLRTTPANALFSASICIMELRYGALTRGNPASLWTKIEQQILPRIQILDFSYKEALKAGEIIHHLFSSGQPIGIEDVMIASIALCNGLAVISANTKHFSRVPDLRIENWFQWLLHFPNLSRLLGKKQHPRLMLALAGRCKEKSLKQLDNAPHPPCPSQLVAVSVSFHTFTHTQFYTLIYFGQQEGGLGLRILTIT